MFIPVTKESLLIIWHRFLLARLHMESLLDKLSVSAIKDALKSLRKGPDSLECAYQEVKERIEGQMKGHRDLAKRVLLWLTYAQRSLKVVELRLGLGVRIGTTELNQEDLFPEKEMVSVCAGLVTVDEESQTISLVHYTTQEYLRKVLGSWFDDPQADIVRSCLTYLSFTAFADGLCSTDEEFETRLREHGFLDYAARYWGIHAHSCQSASIEKQALLLLADAAKVASINQVMFVSTYRYRGYSQKGPTGATSLHLISHFVLTDLVTGLLAQYDINADAKDNGGRTPLSWAAARGHETVVQTLLTTGKVDPDMKNRGGRTPLSCAAIRGHEAVVQTLLTTGKVDPDVKDEGGRTPLSWAAAHGHEAVVQTLLTTGKVDPDVNDEGGRTPLSWAAAHGHEAAIQTLLATGKVDPDVNDEGGRTPLWWAAAHGHEAAIQTLLATGKVDPDVKDRHGRTPLWWAATRGHEAVVQTLLATGKVDPDVKDEGRTPLWWAATRGHEAVVQTLLTTGKVDPDVKDRRGRTPLSWAAEGGHGAIVSMLRSYIRL